MSHYLFKFYFNIARDVIISKYRIFFNQYMRNIELITSRKLENFDRLVCRKAHKIFIALIIHIRLKLIMMLRCPNIIEPHYYELQTLSY